MSNNQIAYDLTMKLLDCSNMNPQQAVDAFLQTYDAVYAELKTKNKPQEGRVIKRSDF